MAPYNEDRRVVGLARERGDGRRARERADDARRDRLATGLNVFAFIETDAGKRTMITGTILEARNRDYVHIEYRWPGDGKMYSQRLAEEDIFHADHSDFNVEPFDKIPAKRPRVQTNRLSPPSKRPRPRPPPEPEAEDPASLEVAEEAIQAEHDEISTAMPAEVLVTAGGREARVLERRQKGWILVELDERANHEGEASVFAAS